ncbi:MAG: hypothetical protein ACI8PT_004608, partial [Gammaproteobacteria bacterium]
MHYCTFALLVLIALASAGHCASAHAQTVPSPILPNSSAETGTPGTGTDVSAPGAGASVLGPSVVGGDLALAIVQHRWQVKIAESNHASIRPGSLYDIVTYFEQNAGFTQPRFNYLFLDLGLGAADPLYPVYQRGRQAGWGQLLRAMLSQDNRHIDHSSVIDTPEGCRVHSTYWVRHIDEFPDRYHAERAAGYTLIDISFNHYERLHEHAQCGRHVSHPSDPNFAPRAYVAPFAENFKTLSDLPTKMLARYEAKIGVLKLVSEEFSRDKWPRFEEVYAFERNSLWFYPKGPRPNYNIEEQHVVGSGLGPWRAQDLIYPATAQMRRALSLDRLLTPDAFAKILGHIDGRPKMSFNSQNEPGNDVLSLKQVTKKHYFTAGLEVIPMGTSSIVRAHLSDPANYRLVSIVIRPFQFEADVAWAKPKLVPQVRFVYQLTETAQAPPPARPLEQLFLHLNFDAVDRHAKPSVQAAGRSAFLRSLDQVSAVGKAEPGPIDDDIIAFALRYTARAVQTVSFSSALTGIWIFGTQTRSVTTDGTLAPLRVVREDVDVGYYSSAYDTVLFRAAAATATGPRRERLLHHLDDLTPTSYRDAKRHDPHNLSFARMTCAQCHQMA